MNLTFSQSKIHIVKSFHSRESHGYAAHGQYYLIVHSFFPFINSHMLFVHKEIPVGCFINSHMLFVHKGIRPRALSLCLTDKFTLPVGCFLLRKGRPVFTNLPNNCCYTLPANVPSQSRNCLVLCGNNVIRYYG